MDESQLSLFYGLSFLCVALAFAFAAYLYLWVKKQKTENAKIQEVSLLIKQGANTFMRREYLVLAKFAAVAAAVILILLPSPIWAGSPVSNIGMAIAYLCGTVLSAIAGKIGILVATLSNARTAEAAQKGIKPAFLIGFRGGAVMGLLVVGCSLLGVAAVLLFTGDSTILLGFSFGASSLALFAKAGGGIFTKTADVSADLTGKVELGIPEDDPRNPAVVADNVGDNVGDVAGMGADLFDSNVAAMASALVLAQSLSGGDFNNVSMVLLRHFGAVRLDHRYRHRPGGQKRRPHHGAELLHLCDHRHLPGAHCRGHRPVPRVLLADLGRGRCRSAGGRDHRHHHRLLYGRLQAPCAKGGQGFLFRACLYSAVRCFLRLYLRPARHGGHCRVRFGGL